MREEKTKEHRVLNPYTGLVFEHYSAPDPHPIVFEDVNVSWGTGSNYLAAPD